MAACDTELSSLPLLSGCPTDNEYFLVGGALGGEGVGQYGRRLWSDVKSCALSGLNFVFNQFLVGTSGPLAPGQTTIILSVNNVIPESLHIVLGGIELPQNDNTQISYQVAYSPSQTTIVFNQIAQVGQQYILSYAFTN